MAVTKPTYEKGKLYQLSMSQLSPDPEQPRKFFDEQALAELSTSIVSHGVLQPILVREGVEGNFIIVSGERRYQAAKNAGLETIPAILTDVNRRRSPSSKICCGRTLRPPWLRKISPSSVNGLI